MSNQIEERLSTSLRILNNRMEFWAANKEKLQPTIEWLELTFPETIQLDVSASVMDITLTGRMGDLIGLVEFLGTCGYTPSRMLDEDTTTGYWNSYFEGDGMPRLWVYWTNPFCTRVPVGTKMEEVTIYEVRCNG
jgi:hypothetical protein